MESPHAPKLYRELCSYYQKRNMTQEAEAFKALLEREFKEYQNIFDDEVEE